MIPRLIHRIWLGGRPVPAVFEAWWRTWEAHHPAWGLLTWTETNAPQTSFPRLWKECCHLSQQSNLLRWEILLRHGGLYVDVDYECMCPIDSLLDGASFVATKRQDTDNLLQSAFVACEPGHPVMAAMVAGMVDVDVSRSLSLGSKYLTKYVRKMPGGVRILPAVNVMPYVPTDARRLRLKMPLDSRLFPGSYAVHHWAHAWMPSGFVPLR